SRRPRQAPASVGFGTQPRPFRRRRTSAAAVRSVRGAPPAGSTRRGGRPAVDARRVLWLTKAQRSSLTSLSAGRRQMAPSDAVRGSPGDGDAPARGDLAPADGSATAPSPVRGVSRRSTALSGVTTIWYAEHHPG